MIGQYLEGLYRRFEEGYESSITDIQKLIPEWKPKPRVSHKTETERATEAASGVAASIGFAALLSYRGRLPEEDSKSEGELAVAVAYAHLVFTAITGHLRNEGIDLEQEPVGAFVVDIAYLSNEFRSRCFQSGLKMTRELLKNQDENVKQWRENLFQIIGFYLILGARRNPDFEADIQKLIVGHSHGLYNALGR